MISINRIDHISQVLHGLNLNVGDDNVLRTCLKISLYSYCGKVDGDIACVWGLAPPTLLSDQAYLWLWHNSDLVDQHKFLFVRHSQLMMEQMLKEFPTIVGHVKVGAEKSKRWLRWLGAEFSAGEGGMLRFKIRKSDG
jgi:hypothetical protein